jgi:hypothetical protein
VPADDAAGTPGVEANGTGPRVVGMGSPPPPDPDTAAPHPRRGDPTTGG